MTSKPLIFQVTSSCSEGGMSRVILALGRHAQNFRQQLVTTHFPGVHAGEVAFEKYHSIQTPSKLRRYWRLFRLIRQYRPALVHFHQEVYTPLLTLRPCLETIHDTAYWPTMGHPLIRFLRKRCTDYWALPSQDAADRLGLNRHTLIVPNGVAIPPESSPATLNLGILTRLADFKGVDRLLRAFAHLRADFPNTRLLIAGDGPERARLEALASGLPVDFLGYMDDLESFWSRVAVFVSPTRRETFGLAIAEAMAHGRAVAASNLPAIRSFLEPEVNGLVFEPEDESQMVAQMRRLLSDQELRHRLGNRARETIVSRFSEEAMVANYEAAYSRILGERCF